MSIQEFILVGAQVIVLASGAVCMGVFVRLVWACTKPPPTFTGSCVWPGILGVMLLFVGYGAPVVLAFQGIELRVSAALERVEGAEQVARKSLALAQATEQQAQAASQELAAITAAIKESTQAYDRVAAVLNAADFVQSQEFPGYYSVRVPGSAVDRLEQESGQEEPGSPLRPSPSLEYEDWPRLEPSTPETIPPLGRD